MFAKRQKNNNRDFCRGRYVSMDLGKKLYPKRVFLSIAKRYGKPVRRAPEALAVERGAR